MKYVFVISLIVCLTAAMTAGEWSDAPPLTTPRTGASAVVVNEVIYVLGGRTTDGTVLNTMEQLKPESDIGWESHDVAEFTTGRMNSGTTVFDGRILMTGGRIDNFDITTLVEIYIPSINEWADFVDLNVQRHGHSAVIVKNTPLVLGGASSTDTLVQEIEWYDETWHVSPQFIISPVAFPLTTVINDTIYMFGGFNPSPTSVTYLGTVLDEQFTLQWWNGPNLSVGRGDGAIAVLQDSIFLMGGNTLDGATSSVEIYHSPTRSMTTGAELLQPRIGATAVTLNNKVYLIGGHHGNPDEPLDLVEVYEEPSITDISLDDTPAPAPAESFLLLQGFPNPFNGRVRLQVSVPHTAQHRLEIFDLSGRLVQVIHRGQLTAGVHYFQWDGLDMQHRQVGSGIYLASVSSGQHRLTEKLVFIK